MDFQGCGVTVAHSELSDLRGLEMTSATSRTQMDSGPVRALLTPAALRGVHSHRVICSESQTAHFPPPALPLIPATLQVLLPLPRVSFSGGF